MWGSEEVLAIFCALITPLGCILSIKTTFLLTKKATLAKIIMLFKEKYLKESRYNYCKYNYVDAIWGTVQPSYFLTKVRCSCLGRYAYGLHGYKKRRAGSAYI